MSDQSIDCGDMNDTATVTQRPKKTRTRKRSPELQLQELLNSSQALDKEPTNDLTIARMKFLQARIDCLVMMQARANNRKLKRALAEVERLTAENSALKQQLAAKPAAARPMTEVERALAKIDAKKGEGQCQ